MKRKARTSLSIAATCLAFLLPQLTLAQSSAKSQRMNSNSMQASARSEAALMVPVEVALTEELDARKVEPGYQFQTRLQDKVQLKNGPELPRGTVLTGIVVTDQMQTGGTSMMALRFTSAELKDGKRIPIEAAIVGVLGPPGGWGTSGYDNTPSPREQWNSGTLKMDVIGVESGVDLHSSIGARNSGVFVSTKKSDVRLADGSRITLAIAERTNNSNGAAGA